MTYSFRISKITSVIFFIICILSACNREKKEENEIVSDLPKWGTAQLIETNNNSSTYDPKIVFDSKDNAIAIWSHSDGKIWANRHTNGKGWETAQIINPGNYGFALNPRIAIDSNDNAIAVWVENSMGANNYIGVNKYSVDIGWGTDQVVEINPSGDLIYNPEIAIDSDGNAIVVCYQNDGGRYNIWTVRYDIETGWGSAQLLETEDYGQAVDPQIAFDSKKNAIAVWAQDDGVRFKICANRYTYGIGWGVAQIIETTNNTIDARDQKIAFDSNDNAIAIWSNYYQLGINKYTAGTGWGNAQIINTGYAVDPQVVFDSNDNAIFVWFGDGICLKEFNPNTDWWGLTQIIDDDKPGIILTHDIAIDQNDNIMDVWFRNEGPHYDDLPYNIWSNRYTPGKGWETSKLIENGDGDARIPNIAIDSNGNAIAVWFQFDGVQNSIFANRFE